MFSFNVGNALAQSVRDIMGRQDNFSSGTVAFNTYYFTGPVPATIEDISFDLDPMGISRNSIALSVVDIRHQEQTANGVLRNVLEGSNRITIIPVKKSVWDDRRQKYRLAPNYLARYDLSDVYRDEVNSAPYESRNTATQSFDLTYQYYYGDLVWNNERRENNASVGYYAMNYGNRYAWLNDQGAFFEFGSAVTVDSVELWQYADTRYTSATIILDWWDTSLNEGAGGWVRVDSPATFNADKEFLWELAAPVTSTRFRVSGADTGQQPWHIREISLLSSTEPYNVETVDITWALVIPYWTGLYNIPFYWNRTDSATQQGSYPMILCDVGQPGDDTLIILNQARNIPGFFNPKVLNFSLEFEDPQM